MAENVTIPFFYNPASNTLSIFSGDCWYRSGRPESCGIGNPFVGSWENIDVDGSHEHVTISNGSSIRVHLRDDGATFCLNAGLGFVPATFAGVGVISEGEPLTLEVTGDIYCYPRDGGGRQLMAESVTIPFFYNSTSNTLSIFSGDCWYRSGHPESCA